LRQKIATEKALRSDMADSTRGLTEVPVRTATRRRTWRARFSFPVDTR
jgi:hypothetical protein